MLQWSISDLAGQPTADVENPLAGSGVSIPLNGRVSGTLRLSFDDRAASQAYPLMRVVKCLYDGEPIAVGPMLKPRFDMLARTVEIPFVDPSYRLERSFVNNRGDTNFNTGTGVLAPFAAADQALIVRDLMLHARPSPAELALGVPDIGIIAGTLQSGGIVRDRTYETGAQVWQQMLDMTGVDDGIDLALTPLDRTDGVWAKLDTFYPQRGFDRSDEVVFEIGLGLDNATQLVWEPAGDEVVNRATFQGVYTEGDPPNLFQSNQADSQILNGIYQAYTGRSDVLFTTTLQALARDQCSTHAFAPDHFDITPALDDGTGRVRNPDSGAIERVPGAFGRPPYLHPKGDYWLGDVIGVRAFDRPTVEFEGSGRMYELALTQDADGAVVPEIKVTPSTLPVVVS